MNANEARELTRQLDAIQKRLHKPTEHLFHTNVDYCDRQIIKAVEAYTFKVTVTVTHNDELIKRIHKHYRDLGYDIKVTACNSFEINWL